MTAFWIIAAALILLTYGLFWWHLRKAPNGERYNQVQANLKVHKLRRQELEQELAEGKISRPQLEKLLSELDRELLDQLPRDHPNLSNPASYKGLSLVLASLVSLPVIAFAVYMNLGRPDLIGAQPEADKVQPPSLEAGIRRLKERLQGNPQDLEGWVLLARSYQAVGQVDQALDAYRQALQLAPDHPDLQLRYGEALAQSRQGNLQGEPVKIIQQILESHPDHPYALWLAGMAALQIDDKENARRYWNRLLAQMPEASPAAKQLIAMMERAGIAVTNAKTADKTTPVNTSPARVVVKVALAPELAAQADPSDALFVFARAAKGPPMPLAIVRKQVKDLPLTVTMDDSMAMMPQMKLSRFDSIVIGARVAKTGDAKGAPGDLEGWTEAVPLQADQPYQVTINQVRK